MNQFGHRTDAGDHVDHVDDETALEEQEPAVLNGPERLWTRRSALGALGAIGAILAGGCNPFEDDEMERSGVTRVPSRPTPTPARLQRPAYVQPEPRRPEIPESELYRVDISRLREILSRSGILVLTHNGDTDLENEFKRVAEVPRELGPVVSRFGDRIVKKRCQPKIITGQDANGDDVARDLSPIDCFVVDATGGELPSNIMEVLGNRKFGLILCAGHVHDIQTLADLSDRFRAEESILMLGGCRTANMIIQYHAPNRLVAATTDSLSTETFTHLARVTAATIIGQQCSTWPEYFRNLQANYSYELQRNPDVYIFPGNPLYGQYVAG